jgi:ferredoxin
MNLIVKGANSSLIFYTKREAANYFRAFVFAIFSGLRVKVGQLKYTGSYNELKVPDAKEIKLLVSNVEADTALKFLNSVYKAGEFQERWEMFIDLIEAKISEYYRKGNVYTSEIPNYIILEAILKEIDERIALTKKDSKDEKKETSGGDKADWSKRFPLNKPGKFYVDEKCIVCDACAATAPKFFKLNEQHAFVFNQPTTPEEIELCNKALKGCPVSAIGNDGDIMMASASSEVKAPAPAKEEKKVEAKVEKVVDKKEEINKEEEVQLLKTLLEKAPLDKLNQIKELLKDLEEVKEETKQEETVQEVKEETVAKASKSLLPETSPDGSKVFPDNVPGLFYVDEKCIECDACVTTAPNFFKIENGHAFVFNQPTNDADIAQCDEAMAGCPVSAINKNQ